MAAIAGADSHGRTPTLYICHVKNILGRVPMMPCFVGGNTQPTNPYRFPTPAKAAASTSSTCGRGATAGDRSARSRFWTPWRRGRRLFARRGRGPARRTSAGGWPLGTAPLRMRRRDSRQFASCFASLLASHSSSSGSPFPIGSSLVHATRQRVRSRATKTRNVKRQTESQKVAEILRRKSTAIISACLTALRGMLLSSGNSAAEIHSENLPSLKLSFSRISQSQVTLKQQEIPLNKSSGGNSAAEIHSNNLCLSNDVVIIWKFCGGNPQRESP